MMHTINTVNTDTTTANSSIVRTTTTIRIAITRQLREQAARITEVLGTIAQRMSMVNGGRVVSRIDKFVMAPSGL